MILSHLLFNTHRYNNDIETAARMISKPAVFFFSGAVVVWIFSGVGTRVWIVVAVPEELTPVIANYEKLCVLAS